VISLFLYGERTKAYQGLIFPIFDSSITTLYI
jgi:hypothetical protein